MQGRYRDKSRPQAQTEMRFRQDRFEGALNDDVPDSRIAQNELTLLENFIAFPEYLEGRGGSQRYSATALPGSGTVRAYHYHASAQVHILHRGAALYTAPANMSAWTQVTVEISPIDYYAANPSIVWNGEGGTTFDDTSTVVRGLSSSNSNAGTLYWSATSTGLTRTLSIYKASAGGASNLVAQGTRTGNGYIHCVQQNDSRLGLTVSMTYTSDDTDLALNTITGLALGTNGSVPNSYNIKIIDYLDDALLMADGTLKYLDIANNKLFDISVMGVAGAISTPLPIKDSGSKSSGTPYGRRYLYTFSRILGSSNTPDPGVNRLNGTLQFESMANPIWYARDGGTETATGRDYAEHWFASTISASAGHSIDLTGQGDTNYSVGVGPLYDNTPLDVIASTHFTHLSLYSTLDIGDEGINPSTSLRNNKELYIWNADVPLTNITHSDIVPDDVLRARFASGFGLRTRFWVSLPAGDTGDVNGGFLYVGTRGSDGARYCQLAKPEYIGFYNEAFQFHNTDDDVYEIRKVRDSLLVICARKTYIAYPTIIDNASAVESVFVVKGFQLASENIGITDYRSIAPISQDAFIARYSDHTIRIFDGIKYSEDLGRKVSSLIRQITPDGSVGAYYSDAYYLWYRTSTDSTVTTACLRLGFGGKAGHGWSRMTGSAWVFPPVFTGAQLIHDANNVNRILVLDSADAIFYWIETFTGYTEASLTKRYKDKVAVAGTGGSSITPKFRTREITGEEESQTIYHEESHLYTRPSGSSYLTSFSINLSGYVDGASTAEETLASANTPFSGTFGPGDIQFFGRVGGKRVQLEYEFTESGMQVVGLDAHFQVHDVPTIGAGAAQSNEGNYQDELAGGPNLTHWLTRPDNDLNRATGSSYTATGTAVTNTGGPDGKSYALYFNNSQYSASDTSIYQDFTIAFWIRNVVLGGDESSTLTAIRLNGTNAINVTWGGNTSLSCLGIGFTTANVTASTWRHYAIVRRGNTLTTYENGVSLGTTTSGPLADARTGGTTCTIGHSTENSQMELFELRIIRRAISPGAAAYYYSNVDTTDTGVKLLPLN